MPVFIPHRRIDTHHALHLRHSLRVYDIECTLTILDATHHPTTQIIDNLTRNTGRHTHIICTVSSFSQSSWWVPFLYGVATERKRRICTLHIGHEPLPAFFHQWPVLKTQQAIAAFSHHYWLDSSTFTIPAHSMQSKNKSKNKPKTIHSPNDFHTLLRSSLTHRS